MLIGATAAADVDNLRFYQRIGFRIRSVERDAFTPGKGYPPHSSLDGIEYTETASGSIYAFRANSHALADAHLYRRGVKTVLASWEKIVPRGAGCRGATRPRRRSRDLPGRASVQSTEMAERV